MHGIEAKQVRIGLDRREVVDGDDLDILAGGLDDRAQNIAADAAEPVDGNANRHVSLPAYGVMPRLASGIQLFRETYLTGSVAGTSPAVSEPSAPRSPSHWAWN